MLLLDARASPFLDALRLLQQLLQFVHPPNPLGQKGSRPCGKSGTWHKNADQIGSQLHQRFARKIKKAPQAVGILLADDPLGQLGVDIARQQPQYLAERQIRVAHAGLGIALPDGNNEVVNPGLSAPRKLGDQGRLAAASFARHEADLTTAGQAPLEIAVELIQFAFAGNKYWFRHTVSSRLIAWPAGLLQSRGGSTPRCG
jgi:hypothetical protein